MTKPLIPNSQKYQAQCAKLYPELDWNMKKYTHLPENLKEEIKEHFDEVMQHMDSSMWDMDDAVGEQPLAYDGYMHNSETNQDDMEASFTGLCEAISDLREWARRQKKTDIEQFVDGKAVNSKETQK